MRKLILLACFPRLSTTPALAADPTGDWLVADAVAHIRVAECNGSMWGAVAWEKDARRQRRAQSRCLKTKQAYARHGDPDQHEEEARARSVGRPRLQRQGRHSTTARRSSRSTPDQLEIQGCVLGFLCGGETWTRVAASDSLESRQQHGEGSGQDAPRYRPKTRGAKTASPKTPARSSRQPDSRPKQAAADPVGDICLLPDIAGFAH